MYFWTDHLLKEYAWQLQNLERADIAQNQREEALQSFKNRDKIIVFNSKWLKFCTLTYFMSDQMCFNNFSWWNCIIYYENFGIAQVLYCLNKYLQRLIRKECCCFMVLLNRKTAIVFFREKNRFQLMRFIFIAKLYKGQCWKNPVSWIVNQLGMVTLKVVEILLIYLILAL